MVAALAKGIRLLRGLLVASLIVSMGTSAHAQGTAVSNRQIDEVLRKAVEEQRLPGVVAMVAQGDTVVYQGAFGKQYAAKGVPMTTDSIFRIASMTKAVTSVAVMQLVERGRVKLDEPAGTYLPELARVVTVHQRRDDGTLSENPPQEFKPVQFLSGGGGLYSTAADYLKFTRMLLGGGKLGKSSVLQAETVALNGAQPDRRSESDRDQELGASIRSERRSDSGIAGQVWSWLADQHPTGAGRSRQRQHGMGGNLQHVFLD